MKGKIILWAYSIAGLTNLASHLAGSETLEFYTKPLLMPLLIYFIYQEANGNITLPRLLLAGALVFSWGGDVALLFSNFEYSFLIGLGSFLIAQLLYMVSLNKATTKAPGVSFISLWPLLIYGIILLWLVLPHTGPLLIPVIVYAMVLLGMLSSAMLRKNKTTVKSFRWAVAGAALFVLSDSILAVNKFGYSFDMSHLWVMATYICAQYLLVRGIMDHPTQST